MNFHGGQEGGKDYKDYSVNIPPIQYEPAFRKRLINEVDHLLKYPEINGESLIKILAQHHGLDPREIILGNGATELMYLFARAFQFKHVMIIEPTFTEYRRAFKLADTKCHTFELDKDNHFALDVDRLIYQINKCQAECLVLCNPNNPTGHLYKRVDLETILKACPQLVLMIDESFIDFVDKDYQAQYEAFLSQSAIASRLVRLRSMTKIYAIPGLRLGYARGSNDCIAKMMRYKEPWTLNQMALAAGAYLVNESDYDQTIYKWCRQEMLYMFQALSRLKGIDVYKGEANYHLIKLKKMSGDTFRAQLDDNKIYLRPCTDFRGLDTSYYRIALKEHDENAFLINKLEEILNDEK